MKNLNNLWFVFFLLSVWLLSGCSILSERVGTKGNPSLNQQVQSVARPFQIPKPDHLVLAERLVQEGFYDVATAQLEKIMNNPTPRVWDLAGVCARETGDISAAKTCFAKALVLDPENGSVFNNLGILLAMNNEPAKARTALETAVALDPGRMDFRNNLGYLLMIHQDYKLAERHFKKCLEQGTSDPAVINNLAICLGLQQKDRDAYTLLKKQSGSTNANYNMACIRAAVDNKKKAADLLTAFRDTQHSTFEIQSDPARLQRRIDKDTGVAGDVAHKIYDHKYKNAMEKD